MEIFILLAMIFCHIIDDYCLQGILASMKQKSWWEKSEGYSEKYRYDYLMALIMHGFSWTFMMMLPIFIVFEFQIDIFMCFVFLANWIIHVVVDDLKANEKKINLTQDQIIHLIQIFITFVLFTLGVISYEPELLYF